ncbi:MAG: hypothetical protein K2N31_07040 [Treponemataceae bacterium]|nr:hypothetical protein [Treponemataceae bacterium]
MILCPAQPFDLPSIMQIERGAFIPPLQEKPKVFDDRLRAFPQGFFVLSDSSVQTVGKAGHAVNAGYFCSELWRGVPADDKPFKINHRASKSHCRDGSVLYVSSFALRPEYQGKRLARPFFLSSLAALCGAFAQIKTVLLLASEEWQSALRVYAAAGFAELRRAEAFFPSLHKKAGCDGIVMTCAADVFRREGILRHNGNGSVVIGEGQ